MTGSRQRTIIIITVAVFVLFAVVIIVRDWGQVSQILGKAQWQLTLVAVIFTLVSYFCLSFGYVLVNRVFGIKTGWWRLFEIGIVSSTLNNILGFLGAAGHSLRVELIKRRGIDSGEVLAASIFHSFLNNAMLLLLLAVGLIGLMISHTVYGGGAVGLMLISAFLIISIFGSTAIIFIPRLKAGVLRFIKKAWHFFTHHDITTFLSDLDHGLTHGLVTLKGRSLERILLLGLMAAEWAFQAVALWFCFDALGKTPNFGVLLSGFGIGISAGTLSMVPGGLGVQEASMSGVYALLGISFTQAALAAILFRVVYDFIPFFISLTFYARLIRKAFVI